MMKSITILVPCYNEAQVLEQLYKRIVSVIDKLTEYEFKLLFVDDGSSDETLTIMKELHQLDERVSWVELSRNFGKEIAMIAGIDQVDSDALIIMDADLQDPPEVIPELINWWEQGYEDVYAQRASRAGESFFKKFSSKLYYRLLQRMSDIKIQTDVGDFRLLDRQCIEALKQLRESQRYTKGMFDWIGFKKKAVLFDRDARVAGETKWNYWKLFNLAIEGITSFTIAPLRAASFMGGILACVSLFYMVFIVVRTLIFGNPVAGYPSLVSIILFIGGVQLLFLGIIGEYLGRVFNESKQRPLYLIRSIDGKSVLQYRDK